MSTDPSHDDAALDAELAVIEALADKAMAGWNDRLSPADRARAREAIIEALATHPNASQLVSALAARPVVQGSGEVGGDAAVDEAGAVPGPGDRAGSAKK